MTEQEKALKEIMDEDYFHNDYEYNPMRVIKKIIQRYPQILAEKVWEGRANAIHSQTENSLDDGHETIWVSRKLKDSNIEVFIREVVS